MSTLPDQTQEIRAFDFDQNEGTEIKIPGTNIFFTLVHSTHDSYYRSVNGKVIIVVWEHGNDVVVKELPSTGRIFRKRFGVSHGQKSNSTYTLEFALKLAGYEAPPPKEETEVPNLMLASSDTTTERSFQYL